MTTIEYGIVQVYTGDGKGKTTAAVGAAVRAVGAGKSVAFVQFIKGGAESSELAVLRDIGVRVERPAKRSTGLLGNGITDADRAAAAEALAIAREIIDSGAYDFIVLDEVCIAIRYDLVAESDVIALLDDRFPGADMVLTGRGASETLMERADLVTEMVAHKHHYDSGRGARLGVEY